MSVRGYGKTLAAAEAYRHHWQRLRERPATWPGTDEGRYLLHHLCAEAYRSFQWMWSEGQDD